MLGLTLRRFDTITRDQEQPLRSAFTLVAQAAQTRTFSLLVIIDVILIGVHVFTLTGSPGEGNSRSPWLLDVDQGWAELVEYIIMGITSIGLLAACISGGTTRFLGLAAFLFYVLLDNAFMFHEKMGALLYPEHARAGELIYWIGLGTVFLISTALSFWNAAKGERIELLALGMAVGAIGSFAVVADAIHSVGSKMFPSAYEPLVLFEEAGELLTISLLLAVAVGVLKKR